MNERNRIIEPFTTETQRVSELPGSRQHSIGHRIAIDKMVLRSHYTVDTDQRQQGEVQLLGLLEQGVGLDDVPADADYLDPWSCSLFMLSRKPWACLTHPPVKSPG